MPARATLITGGVRSGKSAYAEALLADLPTVYIAPGPAPDPVSDPEWAERVRAHRNRRPAHWSTVETTDVAGALRKAAGPALVDCLGTWVTAVMDELDGWQQADHQWRPAFEERLVALVAAWQSADGPVIAVTNEVGMGVVPDHRSGRVFRDLLGTVNQRLAAVSDEVLLVVCGRVLRL